MNYVDDSILKQVATKGKYYCPASKHYPNIPNCIVKCDRCNKQSLNVCIGYNDKDLCMKCVAMITDTFTDIQFSMLSGSSPPPGVNIEPPLSTFFSKKTYQPSFTTNMCVSSFTPSFATNMCVSSFTPYDRDRNSNSNSNSNRSNLLNLRS